MISIRPVSINREVRLIKNNEKKITAGRHVDAVRRSYEVDVSSNLSDE